MDNIVKFKRSSVTGKLPLPSQLAYGELAVNFSADNPFLSIKNNQDQIEKFLSEKGLMSLLTESYYDKQTINQMFEAFDPSGEIDFDNYYEKAEADAKFQAQSGMSFYLLASEAENLYQPKGNYLTEHQDISYLATKQELESYQSISGMSSYLTVSQAEQDFQPKGDYVVPSDLNDYALKSELPSTTGLASEEWVSNNFSTTAHTHSDLATKAELENYLTIASASTTYATKSEIPDISDLATKSEIPDTSNFITSAFTESQYQAKGTYVVPSDLDDYALKSELPTVPDVSDFITSAFTEEHYAQVNHTHSQYAEKSEIPDTSNFITSAFTEDRYQPKGNYLTEHQSLENYYTKSEADNKFLTSHQDLSDYALKSEIPDVSNFVTSAFTDATYAKKGEAPTDVYTKSESDSKFQPQSGMTDYALKSELPSTTGLASETWVSNNFSTTAHTHSEYAEKTDLANYMPNSGMTDYALKSEIPNSYTKTEADNLLAGKANSAHTHTVSDITDLNIPSVEGLASEAWVSQNFSTTAHTHSDLATKAELDDYLTIASASTIYATKEELEEFTPSDNYAGTVWTGTLSEYNNLTVIDTDTLYVITDANQQYVTSGQVESMVSGYTNLTEVQTLLEGYSTTSHTHSYNDLTDKPTIPSTTGLASETWVTNNFAGTGHTHSQYLTETSADTRYARVVSLTQAQYDALVQNDQVEQGVLYCIIEQSNS